MKRTVQRKLLPYCLIGLFTSAQAFAVTIANEDFEDGNVNGWSLNGNIIVHRGTAIGQYALRHKSYGTSVLNAPTTGYENVSISMNLAATSLENGEDCYAEVSTNGGSSWSTVVEVNNGNANLNIGTLSGLAVLTR